MRAVTLETAGIVLVLVNWGLGRSLHIPRREWPIVALFSVFYVALLNLLFTYSQMVAPSGRMAIVAFSMPIWASPLALWILHEPLTPARRAGLVFGVLGLVALVVPTTARSTILGWALALTSAWCWAISTILFKRFPLTAAPLAVVTWQLLLGGLALTLGMFYFEGPPKLLSLSKAAQWALVYNVASQAISQVLWFDVVRRLPTAVAGLGVLVVPSLAVIGSMIILRERPSWLDVLGLLLITSASAIVQIASFVQWRRQRSERALG